VGASVRGATATTSGEIARLSWIGLTADPTSTPNANKDITETPIAHGEGKPTQPGGPLRLALPSSPAAGVGSACGNTPIHWATASESAPRLVPHWTQ
jgi:hypothetical protein